VTVEAFSCLCCTIFMCVYCSRFVHVLSPVVRALDSRLKDRGFESLQERWDLFCCCFSSPGSAFCADSYFGIRSTPVLPQQYIKDPGHSAQSTGGRLHLNTHSPSLRMWLCLKWHGAWVYGVHRTRRDGSSFMWHQPCQRCKYTTSVDIQKRV